MAHTTNQTIEHRRVRLLAATVLVLLLVPAPAALAHVELVVSNPLDGENLAEAPAEIRLEFSAAAVIAGDGIVLYDETGAVVPTSATSESETVVVITPAETIGPGQYLVTWTMQAGDTHPRNGSFVFSVAKVTANETPPAADSSEEVPAPPAEAPAVFETLSQEQSTTVADWVGRVARTVSFGAVLLGLGAFVFATLVFEGSAREARMVGYWGRRAGLAIIVAVPLEVVSQAMLLGGGSLQAGLNPTYIVESVQGTFGLAVLMRAVGGLGLFLGTRLVTSAAGTEQPEAGVAGRPATILRETFQVAASPIAVVGAASVALSFIFDGHTAVTAPSWLVRVSSVVHVAAAATWLGGVAMLAAVFTSRRRRGAPLEAARLVVPFSTVAGVAVGLVGVAGAVLAVATVDAWSDLFSTAWGRALLSKLALVAVAAGMGAYNHFALVPVLKSDPSVDGPASDHVARSVRVEIMVLLAVVAVTAVLVGLAA